MKESSLKISQEIHTNRNMSNTKTWLGFAFYTYDKLENPKRFKHNRAELEFCRKNIQTRFSIDQA